MKSAKKNPQLLKAKFCAQSEYSSWHISFSFTAQEYQFVQLVTDVTRHKHKQTHEYVTTQKRITHRYAVKACINTRGHIPQAKCDHCTMSVSPCAQCFTVYNVIGNIHRYMRIRSRFLGSLLQQVTCITVWTNDLVFCLWSNC